MKTARILIGALLLCTACELIGPEDQDAVYHEVYSTTFRVFNPTPERIYFVVFAESWLPCIDWFPHEDIATSIGPNESRTFPKAEFFLTSPSCTAGEDEVPFQDDAIFYWWTGVEEHRVEGLQQVRIHL